MSIGILSIQGSVEEHAEVLKKLNVSFLLVRTREDLDLLTHLIIPGGESTTIIKLLKIFDMWDVLVEKVKNQELKVFGTCAGAIICQKLGLDVRLQRNGFGAQQESFSAKLISKQFPNFQGIFIRAPRFLLTGKNVEILANWNKEAVLVRQNNILAASFHPELGDDMQIHNFFIKH